MSEYLAEHWILSIVATIVLGAIGSGLYEIALKPISRKIASLLFTIITFNAKRSRDNIYKEAAKGHHEISNLIILLIIIATISILIITVEVGHYVSTSQIKEIILPFGQSKTLLGVFLFVVINYSFISINKTNLVITYYNQCMKSAKPFLDSQNFLLIEQRYSLMKTKEEYDAIISQLADVMHKNSASLPDSYI